jgi:hypothetical protein
MFSESVLSESDLCPDDKLNLLYTMKMKGERERGGQTDRDRERLRKTERDREKPRERQRRRT